MTYWRDPHAPPTGYVVTYGMIRSPSFDHTAVIRTSLYPFTKKRATTAKNLRFGINTVQLLN